MKAGFWESFFWSFLGIVGFKLAELIFDARISPGIFLLIVLALVIVTLMLMGFMCLGFIVGAAWHEKESRKTKQDWAGLCR